MTYDRAFFRGHMEGALRSARVVVPALLELIQPGSVLDVGCGLGAWLRVFSECGIADVWGVDGDYVARDQLLVPAGRFVALDLQHPERLSGRYDIVVCLEVAEHLPASVAPRLVAALAARAPVVLFSAAVPGQGGTNHINEQWPDYWDALFAKLGLRTHDVLRPQF